MKYVEPLILCALRGCKWIGHPACFVLMLAGTSWSVSKGLLSPAAAIPLMACVGVVAGFRLALTTFSHIVVKHPDTILQVIHEWQRDGRWDALLAHVARARGKH